MQPPCLPFKDVVQLLLCFLFLFDCQQHCSKDLSIFGVTAGGMVLVATHPSTRVSQGWHKNKWKPIQNAHITALWLHFFRRFRAEYILKNSNKQDGLFLIRRSRECFYTYIISLYHGGDIKHFKIKKNRSEKSTTFALESDKSRPFSSLSLLIEHYKHCKVKCKFLIIILTTMSQLLFSQWQRDFSLRLATFDHQLEDRWGQTKWSVDLQSDEFSTIGKMELLFHQFE